MVATESQAQSGAQRLVEAHLMERFSLRADQLKLIRLSGRDLPAGSEEFYAEFRGGRDDNINCLVYADRAYCSRSDGEFQRFMADYRYFDKTGLSAPQVMRLYALLALPRQLKYIDARALTRDAAKYQAFPGIAPPALAHTDAGMTLAFCATPALQLEPTQWIVTLSRDYQLDVRQGPALGAR